MAKTNLTFSQSGNVYVSTFSLSGPTKLHIELSDYGFISLQQKDTDGTNYDDIEGAQWGNDKVVDFSVYDPAGVYETTVRVVSSKNPSTAYIRTTD